MMYQLIIDDVPDVDVAIGVYDIVPARSHRSGNPDRWAETEGGTCEWDALDEHGNAMPEQAWTPQQRQAIEDAIEAAIEAAITQDHNEEEEAYA